MSINIKLRAIIGDKKVIAKFREKTSLEYFYNFLIDMQKKMVEDQSYDSINTLMELLIETSRFQDKNLKKILKIEKILSKDQLKGPIISKFTECLIVCGRERYKTKRHISPVKNLNKEISFDPKNFYLEMNHFYSVPQPISYIRYLKKNTDKNETLKNKKINYADKNAEKFVIEKTTTMIHNIKQIMEW
jgi:hypothetical protein